MCQSRHRISKIKLKKMRAVFCRAHLAGGEARDLRRNHHGFVVEPGAFDVMIGASSADIRLKDQVEVTR
jgi:hypothetical protein